MSVDFFPCDSCGECICECGDFERCECGRRWCDRACANKDGWRQGDHDDYEYGESSCAFCRDEEVEDSLLVEFLLKELGLSRREGIQRYLESLPPGEDEDEEEPS